MPKRPSTYSTIQSVLVSLGTHGTALLWTHRRRRRRDTNVWNASFHLPQSLLATSHPSARLTPTPTLSPVGTSCWVLTGIFPDPYRSPQLPPGGCMKSKHGFLVVARLSSDSFLHLFLAQRLNLLRCRDLNKPRFPPSTGSSSSLACSSSPPTLTIRHPDHHRTSSHQQLYPPVQIIPGHHSPPWSQVPTQASSVL
ncbi:uncharacterized protein B0H64DRAFT_207658 [Chaetomium fimeti]|uniref:Uncharacterized protein n=1 Tax=Chaetomium fimeti TaxID=1854472 RepID=A0AAE0HAZ5_9PEZI|nr:hypothetical protein B0H64DRAFT_207658 [Chaetomium fimeti]